MGLIADILTLVGVVVAVWQTLRTKAAADAARSAADGVHAIVLDRVGLLSAGQCVGLVNEVRAYLRGGLFESARLRCDDLIEAVRRLPRRKFQSLKLTPVLAQLDVIRRELASRTPSAPSVVPDAEAVAPEVAQDLGLRDLEEALAGVANTLHDILGTLEHEPRSEL